MTIKGEIIHKGEIVQVNDKFKKRDIVIRTEGQYPQEIKLECINKMADQSEQLNVGAIITAHIDITGRQWTSKTGEVSWFNSIKMFKYDEEF